MGYERDQDMYVPLPFSDMDPWIYDDEIYPQLYQYFPLWRLTRISSLVEFAPVGKDPVHNAYFGFTHHRFYHTMSVARVMEHILRQNDYPYDVVELGIFAALLHDIATPALGDATVSLDPPNLHEELHWQDVIDEKGWSCLASRGIGRDTLDEIIKNRGLLGQVLDVADRITYVAQDAYRLMMFSHPQSGLDDPYFRIFHSLVLADPKFGNLYKDVKIDKKFKKVFFTNQEKLKMFLFLRAKLTEKVYRHPFNQARDILIARMIKPFYSADITEDDDLLDPKRLREMDDDQLTVYLSCRYLFPDWRMGTAFFEMGFLFWEPKFERFNSAKEAQSYVDSLAGRENIFIMGTRHMKDFNTGTGYNVMDAYGQIVPFKKFDPRSAQQLAEISRRTRGFRVYYSDLEGKADVNELIKRLKAMEKS